MHLPFLCTQKNDIKMKNALKLFSLFLIIALTACDNDKETIVDPPYIVGEWKMVGQYQEGVYYDGVYCSHIQTLIFKEDKTGTAHMVYCDDSFQPINYAIERRKLSDTEHQIIFTNGGPFLEDSDDINMATIIDNKLHYETYNIYDEDKPNRSFITVVYEKVTE